MVRRALPHGHVAAVLGTLRDIGLDRLLGPSGNRCRDLVIAMIVARLIAPASKLATAPHASTRSPPPSALARRLVLGLVDEDELYVALDWLGERQEAVERALARKHLRAGTLVLYDVSSSYLEGRCWKRRWVVQYLRWIGDIMSGASDIRSSVRRACRYDRAPWTLTAEIAASRWCCHGGRHPGGDRQRVAA